MSILKGIWKGTHNKYEYKFDINGNDFLSTNAFSGFRGLWGPCKIYGNQIHFKGMGGANNLTGEVGNITEKIEAVFEFDISDKNILHGKKMTLKKVSTIGTDCISEFKLEKQPGKLINFINKCLFYGGMVFVAILGLTITDGSFGAAVIGAIIGGGIGYLIAWLVWYLSL